VEDDVSDAQFGGRLVLRDGTGEADLVIDIEDEAVSLLQGENVLGQYSINEVVFVRWSASRIVMSFAGESADFYPHRPNEFVATLQAKQHADALNT
jgi:hypothetical protein